ncbi:M-phase inducer phosphatase isoform X1 [Fopius arisanus]|uniref:protein-tyrosine-phosphatase n=2 Tax=Fopius arisanus TaxID=64838 RepID=A0A0C9QZ59_9HYME|nr:PREDICTED: M-phase inducer phosphatase-like isoform X1 [Fopius arisanus]XP_011302649.1 PREDICTED: M-phase inducer phosphatase-like isoform X1 [Fopius arisanus]XP_011302657.1 PREDICTED: M-phase inducer phosphatase-like isoform X1 [Fopius arisanus]XP_011302666.1 PREDICTED: M-phase inducer phosphatase-like isoform X1 [Fopius arisanus]XP_011302674.1 PREDICTED: M-phase inducer phosphatase-like isoform X1 [Fopius arisanus]
MQGISTGPLEKIMEESGYGSPIGRHQGTSMMISPVAQIAHDLSKSSLSGTPTYDGRHRLDPGDNGGRGYADENNEPLFKNVFKIKSTPEGTVKSRLRGRRLLGMASRRLNSPEPRSPLQLINKENGSALCSTHQSPSPLKMPSTKSRLPLEDCDPNSQDSGYGASFTDREELSKFRFAEPLGVAPKRMSLDSPVRSSPSSKRPLKLLIKKLSSGYESTEDDFNDLLDMDTFMEPTSAFPNDLNKLLSGSIIPTMDSLEKPMETDAATTPEFARTKPLGVRRSISINNDRLICRTPPMSRVRSCLFRSPNATSSTSRLSFDENRNSPYPSPSPKSFKRPDHPTDCSPILVKRCRTQQREVEVSPTSSPSSPAPKYTRHMLQRSHSEAEAHDHIKSAVHRSTTDSDLTGDFSKTCILPLAEGHHEDLKSISAETLSALIRGEFSESVNSYKIVDCRYPYEYEAGHIDGALNLYTKELIEEYLMNPLTQTPQIQPDSNRRNIIVFHCEFSWERGPNLSRYLRNIDRKMNKEHYPALHYPEIYLLHGGYQQFYQHEKALCSPQGYRPMTHPDHEADLRKFRSKSKSWQGEKHRTNGLSARANLKRLGL